jgi:formate hydrogenlyase subunit 4
MNLVIVVLQVLLITALSPFFSGLIKKIKNDLRMRQGASIFQPYYNLSKLFSKAEVVSENASWIFKITPYVVLTSAVAASCIVPLFGKSAFTLQYMGDFLAILFIFALGRFFMGLAGLDTASAFTGMGSSREMCISSLVEPVALVSLFTVALSNGSTNIGVSGGSGIIHFSSFCAGLALCMAALAETSRIPVDNQETHLELTMIHEAMVLEYSGRSLALLELASHIKQSVFFLLIAHIVFPRGITSPYNVPDILSGLFVYLCVITVLSIGVAVVEVSMAKMRLFRVVDYLGFTFVFSAMALIAQAIGL